MSGGAGAGRGRGAGRAGSRASGRCARRQPPAGGPPRGWPVAGGAAPLLAYQAPRAAAELLRRALGQMAEDDPPGGRSCRLPWSRRVPAGGRGGGGTGRPAAAGPAPPTPAAPPRWPGCSPSPRSDRPRRPGGGRSPAPRWPGQASQVWTARLQARQALTLSSAGRDRAAELAAAALAGAEQAGDPVRGRLRPARAGHRRFLSRDHAGFLAPATAPWRWSAKIPRPPTCG